MKTLFIIGGILFAGGLAFGAYNSKSMGGLSPSLVDNKARMVSGSILTGFVLMVVSGIMYLRS